jgi:hypothetical protein
MKKFIAGFTAVLAVCAACKEPLGSPSSDNVVAGTAQPLQNLVTGVVAQDRTQATRFAYLIYPETEARNTLRMDSNEPRYINELIAVPIDPSAFIGGSGWTEGYQTIRAANLLLVGPTLANPGITAGDRAATVGFVQTIKAMDYIRIVQLRDSLGAAIQGPDATTTDPMKTSAAVLAYVSAVLDSGYTSFTAAGVSAKVPFAVPSGYKLTAGYDSTARLALLNRGLKGIVEVYRGFSRPTACAACFATAITAFNAALAGLSATPTAADLQVGPYYQFNPAAPESFSNPLVDNHIYLTDNFASSIIAGDLRSSKIVTASSASASVSGIQLTKRDPITDPNIGSNVTRPMPMVRNALVYLLRAQAEVETGDLVSALRDVNVVHTVEGGLPPLAPFVSAAQARQAILYELRYSFVYDGPWYLVALREYGALTKAYVTQAGMPSVSSDPSHNTDPLQTTLPIPANEAAARNGNIAPQP